MAQTHHRRRFRVLALLVGTLLSPLAFVPTPSAEAGAATQLTAGFVEEVVFGGLNQPTSVRFASDGRVFVAEKRGIVKVFSSLSATTPTVVADLRVEVNNNFDRGLLGFALHPNFPITPYAYVLYARDALPGGSAPHYGNGVDDSDACADNLGTGCVLTSRLVRLTISGDVAVSQTVLIDDWCQQAATHSTGELQFGADGYLYVSHGEGATPNLADFGQLGNPCGDPITAAGVNAAWPTGEGGALRSQDLLSSGDPVGLDGTVIRIDPVTGEGAPGNPFANSTDANMRRIVAIGLRNPFRFAIKPGTSELWLGDVGWGTWEEVDRFTASATVANFGWPCWEGPELHGTFKWTTLCQQLPEASVTQPFFSYAHGTKVAGASDACRVDSGSAVTGVTFAPATSPYPPEYRGALFFADYARGCIWMMPADLSGTPDKTRVTTFASGASVPVQLSFGPDGNLYYVDLWNGSIRRIRYTGTTTPTAVATATPASGPTPLTVTFDGRSSFDPIAGTNLTYSWDLDGNGTFGDATTATVSRTYTTEAVILAQLRVTNPQGSSAVQTVTVTAGIPPVPVISSPTAATTWAAGDLISFAGSATSAGAALPPSALSWQAVLEHCSNTGCHDHPLQSFNGVGNGSFTLPAHEYPAKVRLSLTATKPSGLRTTTTAILEPRTAQLAIRTEPSGLNLVVGATAVPAPSTETVISGSATTVTAPAVQSYAGRSYDFTGWADGSLNATRTITVAEGTFALTARYAETPGQEPGQEYRAITPKRLVDTRNGTGLLQPGQMLTVPIAGTANGVGVDARAAAINLTVTQAAGSGWLTAYPCGAAAAPATSNLNVAFGNSVANLVVAGLGTGGQICVTTSVPTHVIVDLQGWYPATSSYRPQSPTRLMDTRLRGYGLTPGELLRIPMAGVGDVAADASAVIANLTVTGAKTAGWLTALPCDQGAPATSNINFSVGQTIANLAAVPLGGNGDICVTSSAKVHVIVDLQGWHTATSGFHGLVAQRAFDSRSGGGKIPAAHESEIPLAGLFDIPSAPGAVAVNVTVTQPDNAGWLVAYPCGSARPLASTINFNAGDTVANLSISGLGTNGKLCLWSTAAVQVVIDTQGWYNP